MAVAAMVRRVLGGGPPAPGARAADGDLELDDCEAPFAERTIHLDQTSAAGKSL